MELFHFLNLKSQQDLFEYIQNIHAFSKHWVNPSVKMDRVVFSNISAAEHFLENLNQNENLIKKFGVPSIICSLDSAYELDRILQKLSIQKKIKCEILCAETPNMAEDLQYFIQDKLPDFLPQTDPRFSLVHTN